MSTDGDPPRLHALTARGSTLQRGLEAARDRGPSDQQLRDLERGVLAALGAAGAITAAAAVTNGAATTGVAAQAGSTAASMAAGAGWLSTGAAKIAVSVTLAALVSGGAVGFWRLAVAPARRAPADESAAPAPAREKRTATPAEG